MVDIALPERLRDSIHVNCAANPKTSCTFCADLAIAASRIEQLEGLIIALQLVPAPSEKGMGSTATSYLSAVQWTVVRMLQGHQAHGKAPEQ